MEAGIGPSTSLAGGAFDQTRLLGWRFESRSSVSSESSTTVTMVGGGGAGFEAGFEGAGEMALGVARVEEGLFFEAFSKDSLLAPFIFSTLFVEASALEDSGRGPVDELTDNSAIRTASSEGESSAAGRWMGSTMTGSGVRATSASSGLKMVTTT